MMPRKTYDEVDGKSDHDLLIVLVTKVGDLQIQMGELRDGMKTQLADHESRIRTIERMIDQINPVEKIAEGTKFRTEFYALKDNVDDFFSRWKVYVGIFGTLIAILTSVVTALIIKRL